MAKKKGGNPRNRSGGGRVTQKKERPCLKRSSHEGRHVPCLHTSSMKVGNEPRTKHCSWCGARPGNPPNDRTVPKKLVHSGPEPEEVPDSWFSDEEPVIALSIPEWQAASRQGVAAWPPEAQQAFQRSLDE